MWLSHVQSSNVTRTHTWLMLLKSIKDLPSHDHLNMSPVSRWLWHQHQRSIYNCPLSRHLRYCYELSRSSLSFSFSFLLSYHITFLITFTPLDLADSDHHDATTWPHLLSPIGYEDTDSLSSGKPIDNPHALCHMPIPFSWLIITYLDRRLMLT